MNHSPLIALALSLSACGGGDCERVGVIDDGWHEVRWISLEGSPGCRRPEDMDPQVDLSMPFDPFACSVSAEFQRGSEWWRWEASRERGVVVLLLDYDDGNIACSYVAELDGGRRE